MGMVNRAKTPRSSLRWWSRPPRFWMMLNDSDEWVYLSLSESIYIPFQAQNLIYIYIHNTGIYTYIQVYIYIYMYYICIIYIYIYPDMKTQRDITNKLGDAFSVIPCSHQASRRLGPYNLRPLDNTRGFIWTSARSVDTHVFFDAPWSHHTFSILWIVPKSCTK